MKALITTCVALATLAGPALAAPAGLSVRGANTRLCELEATDAGFEVAAQGLARFTKSVRGEAIGVRVEAKVEDKTLLIVSIGTKDGRSFDVGSLFMFMGVGTFNAQSFKDPDLGAFPVDDITHVAVRLSDEVLLTGTCATLDGRQN